MALEIVFSPIAERDLDRIDDFLARYSLDAADALTAQIHRRCAWLARFPKGGRVRPEFGPGIRTFAVARKVVLAYRIEETALSIVRIFYAGQDIDAEMGGGAPNG